MNKNKSFYIMTIILLLLLVLISSGFLISGYPKLNSKVTFNEYDKQLAINIFESSLPVSQDEEFFTVDDLQTTTQEEKEDYIPIEEFDYSGYICLGEFHITGYCDCEECQGEWVGTTALGVAPTVGRTVAVDPDVIPLGTHIFIDGHEYVAEDTGSAINGYDIDIFVSSHEECFEDQYNGYKLVYILEGK